MALRKCWTICASRVNREGGAERRKPEDVNRDEPEGEGSVVAKAPFMQVREYINLSRRFLKRSFSYSIND